MPRGLERLTHDSAWPRFRSAREHRRLQIATERLIVDAVDDLIDSVEFSEITLEIEGDDEGFVIDIEPEVHNVVGAASGSQIDFELTFRGADAPSTEDELHLLTLNVIGDGTVLLDTRDIYVLVPGTVVP